MSELNDLTSEKLNILEKLHEVEVTLAKFLEKFEAHTVADHLMSDRILKLLEHHDKMLLGTNDDPGMKVEVDRLKQKSNVVSFVIGALTVATCGIIVKFVWAAITSS